MAPQKLQLVQDMVGTLHPPVLHLDIEPVRDVNSNNEFNDQPEILEQLSFQSMLGDPDPAKSQGSSQPSGISQSLRQYPRPDLVMR